MKYLKYFFIIFIPFAFLALVLLSFLSNLENKNDEIALKYSENFNVDLQLKTITKDFDEIFSDLMYLAQQNELIKLLQKNTKEHREELGKEYVGFSKNKKLDDQIRYIDESGMEIVRVNFNNGNPYIVPDSKLQYKANRYYFEDTFKLKKHEIYVSPFDLNIEQGKIEQPIKPMIRFATPVYDKEDKKRGILILNYLGNYLIDNIKITSTNKNIALPLLVNSGGYYIIGIKPEEEWGFMYENKKDLTFGKMFPAVWEKIISSESGQIYDDKGLFTFSTIYPLWEGQISNSGSEETFTANKKASLQNEYFWKIISFVSQQWLAIEKQKKMKKFLTNYAIVSSLLGFISILFARAKYNQKKAQKKEKDQYELTQKINLELLEKNIVIEKEQEKSKKLLLNILPEEIVKHLEKYGKIPDPNLFKEVSILFTDFVGFTELSSKIPPRLLIGELNDMFTEFDEIVKKNHCERIKTIGDAYLAVCGIPKEDKNHAENIIKSAIELVEYLNKRNKKSLEYLDTIVWEMRIGIHSGSVIAGIVGTKKYIYDVFGDTINTASRMESYSYPMKITVSEATYKIVKDKFKFIEREEIEVKGKGKMKMYFVNIEGET